MAPKATILRLYKSMLKESKNIPSYNFREHALRRIRYGFKQNKFLKEPEEVQIQLQEAEKNLEIIKRQAIIGHLYTAEKLVIENELRS